jgi:acyl-CoA thioesterase-2
MRLTEETGDDPVLHACALAYLSDDLPTDAVVARHPDRPPRDSSDRSFWSASLDHAIWFHRPFRADAWHLHAFTCRGLIGSRGLSSGAVFDQQGRHVASVAQEVLIRPHRAD